MVSMLLRLNSNVLIKHDFTIGSTSAFYFGDSTTDGTWKISRNGTDLVIERRESGSYVEKGSFVA